jgi:hypothetical protein
MKLTDIRIVYPSFGVAELRVQFDDGTTAAARFQFGDDAGTVAMNAHHLHDVIGELEAQAGAIANVQSPTGTVQ